jgi:integrase/recombinase XerC
VTNDAVLTDALTQDLFAGYELAQRRLGLSSSTITHRARLLTRVAADIDMVAATPADIELWIDGREVTARSRKHYLALLSPFFDWLIVRGTRDDNPVAKIARPRTHRLLPKPISDVDLRTALDAADPRMRAWLTLGAYQGLRAKEVAGLERDAILEDRAPPMLFVANGKGDKERVVPLHPETLAALRAAGLPKAGRLFRLRSGAPVTPTTLSCYVKRHFLSLGMDWSMHSARHWFGTSVYAACRDLRVTQELLGHADPQTTAGYAAWSPGAAVEVVVGLTLGNTEAARVVIDSWNDD